MIQWLMDEERQPSYFLPRHEFEFYKEATEVALKLKAANNEATLAKIISIVAVMVAAVAAYIAVYHH